VRNLTDFHVETAGYLFDDGHVFFEAGVLRAFLQVRHGLAATRECAAAAVKHHDYLAAYLAAKQLKPLGHFSRSFRRFSEFNAYIASANTSK
jgi:hypothetical protein